MAYLDDLFACLEEIEDAGEDLVVVHLLKPAQENIFDIALES